MPRKIEMVYSYIAFGLSLKSEIAIPELMDGDGSGDVSIRFGKADLGREAKANGSFFKANEDEIQFNIKNSGVITVRQGREIIIDPLPDADPASVRFPIINYALASILQQRGFLVFHASAVAIDGKAAIFLGFPGSGKSTIAAAMHSCGYRVLSDEITAVQAEGDMPMVLSGLPHIRLASESAKYLGHDPENMPKVRSDEDKRAYSARKGFLDRTVQLKRIYVLKPSNENLLEPIGPQEAFYGLIKNYYTAGLLVKSIAPSHLKQCARVISNAAAKSLSRADGLNHIPDLINLVVRDMAE